MKEIIKFGKSVTMTSLEIAEVTGKRHYHILRDIDELLKQGVDETNFGLINYADKRKRKQRCYQLSYKGVLLLASGYNPILREKIINRWEELDKNSKPQLPETYLDALKQLVAFEEQKQQLALENKRQAEEIDAKTTEIAELSTAISEMHPKVNYVDTILSSKETFTTTQIAQDYGLSAKSFNILLRNFGIQRKVGGQWILCAKYLPYGFVQSVTVSITHPDGSAGSVMYTKWTQKGRLFLYNELKHREIRPLIEK